MDKYLFLDIDGVLVTEKHGLHGNQFVKKLNVLEGVKVVISSSWYLKDAREFLRENGLELEVVGATEKLEVCPWMCRGNSVAKWLQDNVGEFPMGEEFTQAEYCILDDETDYLLWQSSHLIHVFPQLGLRDGDIKRAKKILKI